MTYIDCLYIVIDYLEGKYDIYNGGFQRVLTVWNDAYDEMIFLGYDPNTASGIRNYIARELS